MITIVDTTIGNLKSIQNMFNRLSVPSMISNDVRDIKKAKKILIPGVGSFDQGVNALKTHDIFHVLQDKSMCLDTKILGICLGMQLLADESEEGLLSGLGIIAGKVKRLLPDEGIRIPHMGWNYAVCAQESDLFKNFENTPRFYFTHSYSYFCKDKKNILAETMYGNMITSAICLHDRIFGVQFHPEKSHRYGMILLNNFAQC